MVLIFRKSANGFAFPLTCMFCPYYKQNKNRCLRKNRFISFFVTSAKAGIHIHPIATNNLYSGCMLGFVEVTKYAGFAIGSDI